MGIITGIFVQAAVADAENHKDSNFKVQALTALECNASTEDRIDLPAFEALMRGEVFQKQMRSIGINPYEAVCLFEFLNDGSNLIDKEELLAGLLRLRAGARFIDILPLMNDIDELKKKR